MIPFPKPDAEQFFLSYLIRHFDVSQDEQKVVFSSNLNGSFNLWAMDVDHPFPYPLTYHNQASNFVKIDPKNRYILTGIDHDGDENYQIYATSMEGGVPYPILTGEKEDKFFFGSLSQDGERIYYTTSKGNPRFLNLHRYDLKTKEDQLLLQGEGASTYLAEVSPEEESFTYIVHKANTYVLAYVQKGEEKILLTPSAEVMHTAWSTRYIDEHTIYFLTNYEDEFSYLASFNLETGTFTPLLKIEGEDMKEIYWHKESSTCYIVTEKGVVDQLYSYHIENSGADLQPIKPPIDVIEQVKVAKSGTLYLLGRSATKPMNIYSKHPEGDWQLLTENRVLGVSEDQMVDPDVVSYPSFDGLEIEALLFKAKPEVANGYTIFWPHGGPQASERKFFRGLFQYLLGRGFTIFAPNFRGSTGYGASFTKMVEGDWGEGPRLDCVTGIEWLFENEIADRDKLFLVGGSYGGYMALLLSGRHPEYFRAVIDIFGVSNLFTFIDSVPEHWKPVMKQWLGDPVEDKERLIKDSPITYLDQMVKPLLVIQGANDPRVVKAESDQIVEALRKNGVEVEYLILEDEGHGFSRKENEINVYRTCLAFLEKHM